MSYIPTFPPRPRFAGRAEKCRNVRPDPILYFGDGASDPDWHAISVACDRLSVLGACDSVPVHMAPGERGPSQGQTAQLVNLGTMLFACVAVGLAAGYFAGRGPRAGPTAPPARRRF